MLVFQETVKHQEKEQLPKCHASSALHLNTKFPCFTQMQFHYQLLHSYPGKNILNFYFKII